MYPWRGVACIHKGGVTYCHGCTRCVACPSFSLGSLGQHSRMNMRWCHKYGTTTSLEWASVFLRCNNKQWMRFQIWIKKLLDTLIWVLLLENKIKMFLGVTLPMFQMNVFTVTTALQWSNVTCTTSALFENNMLLSMLSQIISSAENTPWNVLVSWHTDKSRFLQSAGVN